MTKVQRYKVGYYSDEWGSSNTPCLVPADNGYAVKFEDYFKLEAENERLNHNLLNRADDAGVSRACCEEAERDCQVQ